MHEVLTSAHDHTIGFDENKPDGDTTHHSIDSFIF